MERISEIFVVLENRPSTLGELCSHLSENGINIEAIGLFQDTAKLFVKNVSKATKLLNKLNYETEIREVLKVDLENRPGALSEIATKLGEIRDVALADGSYGPAVTAEIARAKLAGLMVDKKELKIHKIDSMSREQLEARLQELLAESQIITGHAEVIEDSASQETKGLEDLTDQESEADFEEIDQDEEE